MEALTTEDTKKMKEMLYQRNLILDFDKDNEKELLKLKSEVETTLKEKRTETNKKLSVGDV
jgi:Trm5-related predicted tRNA methylase